VLIPSVDLMGGKVVQLVQGKKKVLEFDNFEEWVARFASFSLVQLIDLDAATGRDANASLIDFFLKRLPCQVGGGIRKIDTARQMLDLGARRVIFGSSLIRNDKIDTEFAKRAADELGMDKVVFAIDSRGGRIAVRGWQAITKITPVEAVQALEPFCSAFLYTHIDTEGLMGGLPLAPVRELRDATHRQLIAAGGISSHEEIERLHQMGVDAVVGMALYLGKLTLPDTIPLSK
jgi:phosphoribosylformimino-5-aminoimidazole carboxamide ribotide isomerase